MRVLAVLVVVALSGCLNDFDDGVLQNDLRIQDIDVAAPSVRSGSVDLVVNVTLDNERAKSGEVEILVKAFDTSTGLLVKTVEADVGIIARDTTKLVSIPVTVDRSGGMRIEVVIVQDDRFHVVRNVGLTNLAALAPNIRETGLRIQGMDFSVTNVTSRVTITSTIYVSNEGTALSQPLRAHVKAREVSTSLIADEVWLDIGTYPPDETHAVEATLNVPDGYNYEVEVVLWDDAFIVGRGQGNVQLLPTFTVPKDKEVKVSDPDIGDFVRGRDYDDGDGASTPGLSVVAAIAIIGGITWMKRRK